MKRRCVCAEINSRNCSIHGAEPEPPPLMEIREGGPHGNIKKLICRVWGHDYVTPTDPAFPNAFVTCPRCGGPRHD